MAFYNPYSNTGMGPTPSPYMTPIPGGWATQNNSPDVRYIPTANTQEMLNYPIAPGQSATFICESERKLYVKSRGFSPFDAPVVEEYDIVKRGDVNAQPAQGETYALRSELAAVAQKLVELEKTIKGGETHE